MNFHVFFIFVLRTVFIPLAVTQSENFPCLMCAYSGTYFNSNYTLSVADVPDRCKTVMFSGYYMDAPMADSDIKAITSLVSAGKFVYTTVTFPITEDPHWDVILSSNFTTTPNEQVENLIQFLKTNKISGVVFDRLQIYKVGIPDYANKLKSLILKLKTDVPSLKVAIYLNAIDYEQFGCKDIFDFTVINDVIDFYVVDMASAKNDCNENTAKTGRIVLSGGSNGVITLEQIFQGIKSSPLDQNKIMINFYIMPIFIPQGGGEVTINTYIEYCKRSDTDKGIWCADSTQMFYDQVIFSKPFIKGLMLGMLDWDDFEGTNCGCGKFPVTNTYIDAWESKPITCCDQIA